VKSQCTSAAAEKEDEYAGDKGYSADADEQLRSIHGSSVSETEAVGNHGHAG
jgi:hypothetical protein